MYFDPLYLVIMGVSAVLSLGAQAWVRSAFRKFKKVPTGHGMRGADVAALILETENVSGVRIEQTPGFLSDHYDPSKRTLRLSPDTFQGQSVAAAGVAAHEVGHALQHAQGYWPMRVRQTLVPVANIGTNLGVILVIIGLMLGAVGLAKVGVVLFAGFVAFALVTLPVELDASSRAKKALASSGVFSAPELDGVARVLRAAAATYVASAATAILQLLYFVLRVQGGRRSHA